IRNALPLLREPVFAVVNADVYSRYDYAGLAQTVARLQPQTLAHLVLVDNPPHHPAGDFRLEQGLVHPGGESALTFSGIGVYRASLFDPVLPGSKQALAPLLHSHLASGRITGEHYRGEWHDIGTPQRLTELETRLAQLPEH
ncbi:MAG: mannose-1-phosphate guanylyltransferase, partial [Betaproteobacteria bacterium]